ncbi:hypothetical protein JR316_0009185 [Psilocybe cubensis]|uniref:Uncharacterized protein n=1 Tax=Psilocybe cubensis TaxID=181762 RepID=A0ACB8GTC8_PSICU|nr:hypothetical protein JR316_0009185 [Psilocybe cubensis]KAH9478725.1 hypothetical protein JR316_0009185 [Psilocybe cubensis]
MAPSFETHSQSSLSTSNSPSMGDHTHQKIDTANSNALNHADDVNNTLKLDLNNHILDNVSTAQFVEPASELEPGKSTTTLDSQFAQPDGLSKSYQDIVNNKSDPGLHMPFDDISRALYMMSHFNLFHTGKVILRDFDESNVIISPLGRTDKPDDGEEGKNASDKMTST